MFFFNKMIFRSILYHIFLLFLLSMGFFIYREYDNRITDIKNKVLHQKIVNDVKDNVVLMNDVKEAIKNSVVESVRTVLKDNPDVLIEIVKELEKEKNISKGPN